MKLDFVPGPVFEHPIRSMADVDALRIPDPEADVPYVLEAIRILRRELASKVPLIGFGGAPFTLACYMVEGKGSKNFSEVKKLIYNNPDLAHAILDKLAKTVADYLSAKIEAGCNAVQIFDTWGGILSQKDFEEFSLRYVEKIISQIKRKNEPVIFFAKGVHYNLSKLASIGADVLGFDWTMDLGKVRKEVGNKVALQGNLDPTVLYADKSYIKKEVKNVLNSFGKGNGHVFNLGHGVLPDIDPENVKALVQYVKEESRVFHHLDTENT